MNFKPTEKVQELLLRTKEIADKWHCNWIYLPIYPKQTIINSDIIPEENIE